MRNKKTPKSMFIASLIALCLCVAALIGATFAWFTDTASTGVNSITAGNLRVAVAGSTTSDFTDISYVAGTKADGTTIESRALRVKTGTDEQGKSIYKALDGNSNILWEPGCSFETEYLKVMNTGNLALKYIGTMYCTTDTTADYELAKVIEVYVSVNGADYGSEPVGTLDEILTSEDPDGFLHGTLSANSSSDVMKFKLHMKEEAGNQYQNLTLSGLTIRIDAAQQTEEYDSVSNTYDEDAEFNRACLTFYSESPFTITAQLNSVATGLQVSYDGARWVSLAASSTSILTAVQKASGKKYYIYLRGYGMTALSPESGSSQYCTKFTVLQSDQNAMGVRCAGNIMTLLNYKAPDSVQMGTRAFFSLFVGSSALVQAPELPSTSLSKECYYQMFSGCSKLEATPDLPATELTESCYYSMFRNCTSLEHVSTLLHVKSFGRSSLSSMFKGCTTLCFTSNSANGTAFFHSPSDASVCCNNMFDDTNNGSPETDTAIADTTYYYWSIVSN